VSVPSEAPIRALLSQFADAPVRGAELVRTMEEIVDGGKLPVVLPAAIVATERRRIEGRPGADDERRRWLEEQLARTYGAGPPGAWSAAVAAGDVELVILAEATDPPADPRAEPTLVLPADVPADPPADPTLAVPVGPPADPAHDADSFGGVTVRRVELAPGQVALHPLSPRPLWASVVGLVLVGVACWAILWSYDYMPAVCAGLAIGLAATFATVGGYPPLVPGRRPGIGSWPRYQQLALSSAGAGAGLSFLVGLLAIDQLTARDALIVLVPMVVTGAWIAGGDALAIMWYATRGRRLVADLGSVRVVTGADAAADPVPR
jgi:hypothetical protein